MPLTGLREDGLKLILFGGKGGVGKTTCASSTSLYLAEDFNTLLFSTDPAHSLSDSLDRKIGDETKCLEGIKNLSALEISAEKALSNFKYEYEDEIKNILDTSTYLDQDDIDSVIALPIPGIDEVMGFKTIVDLIENAQYDKYIVDSAPTGHALRLLTLPDLLNDWIKVMAKMRWKYRVIVQTFGGKYTPDESDDFLVQMKKIVKRMSSLLRDNQRCEFIAVTIPEAMAISETERLLNSLNGYGIKVKQLVINNVYPDTKKFGVGVNCTFCRERRKAQEHYIKKIQQMFSHLKISMTPLQPQEVKGLEALNNFKKWLF